MKQAKKSLLFVSLISVLFFIAGFYFYADFIDFVLPKVEGCKYQDSGVYYMGFLFQLVLALIPFLIYYTWKLAAVTSPTKKIISLLLISGFMIAAILIRQQMIRSYFAMMKIPGLPDVAISYPLNKIHFEFYMLAGICAGCIVSYFLLRPKKRL